MALVSDESSSEGNDDNSESDIQQNPQNQEGETDPKNTDPKKKSDDGKQTNGGGPGDPPGDGRGSATSFSFGFAFGFGISGEWGTVTDETGDSKGYWTVSANFGLGLDFGVNKKEIIPTNGRFRVEQYEGKGKNLSIGAFFTGESRGGNTDGNFNGFGVDYKERSNSLSPMLGIPLSFGPGDVGVIYQLSKTSFYK